MDPNQTKTRAAATILRQAFRNDSQRYGGQLQHTRPYPKEKCEDQCPLCSPYLRSHPCELRLHACRLYTNPHRATKHGAIGKANFSKPTLNGPPKTSWVRGAGLTQGASGRQDSVSATRGGEACLPTYIVVCTHLRFHRPFVGKTVRIRAAPLFSLAMLSASRNRVGLLRSLR